MKKLIIILTLCLTANVFAQPDQASDLDTSTGPKKESSSRLPVNNPLLVENQSATEHTSEQAFVIVSESNSPSSSETKAIPNPDMSNQATPNQAMPNQAMSNSVTTLPAATGEAIEINEHVKIVPKTHHEENQPLRYTIDLNYPQMEGDNLSPQASQFNKLVLDKVMEEVTQFKKYVNRDMPHMQSLPDDLKHNSLRTDYDVDVIQPKGATLISVRLSNEGFQAGRAHPYHNHKVLNFDLETGKAITLPELFKPKSNYLNVISKYANKKLSEKLEDKWMINEGTKPSEANYKIWNLENDGILITFDEYQVAPYVYGAQEVNIPYSELKSILSPRAPVLICASNPSQCEPSKNENSDIPNNR